VLDASGYPAEGEEMSKQTEALKLALEALCLTMKTVPTKHLDLGMIDAAITAIREALKQQAQQQEPDKDGSPCPEFWDWLPKAYNFEGLGNFTKYNMEVAFLAGRQSVQQQEPVAWMVDVDLANYQGQSEYRTILAWNAKPVWSGTHEINEVLKSVPLYTAPPPRKPWVGLTDDEANEIVGAFDYRYDVARAIEAKLREKNTPQQSKGDA